MLDKSFSLVFNTFFFIHNKSFENMLIERLKQITVPESVSDIVQFFIHRNSYILTLRCLLINHFFAPNTFLFFIYNKPLKDMLIK